MDTSNKTDLLTSSSLLVSIHICNFSRYLGKAWWWKYLGKANLLIILISPDSVLISPRVATGRHSSTWPPHFAKRSYTYDRFHVFSPDIPLPPLSPTRSRWCAMRIHLPSNSHRYLELPFCKAVYEIYMTMCARAQNVKRKWCESKGWLVSSYCIPPCKVQLTIIFASGKRRCMLTCNSYELSR